METNHTFNVQSIKTITKQNNSNIDEEKKKTNKYSFSFKCETPLHLNTKEDQIRLV